MSQPVVTVPLDPSNLVKANPKLSQLIAAAELLGMHVTIRIVQNAPLAQEKGESPEPPPECG